MARCSSCIHLKNQESYTVCRFCHDMNKYEEIGMDKKSTNKDVDELIRDYEILINKYEEAFELYGKIIDEYKKHIELLKEKVRLLEKLNNLHTSHIEELKKHI